MCKTLTILFIQFLIFNYKNIKGFFKHQMAMEDPP